MGNQNRKNAIRAYMTEQGVNYTTAKRAIDSGTKPWIATVQDTTPPVEQTIRFDPTAPSVSELFAALRAEPIDLSDHPDTEVYDPMKHFSGEVSTGKTFMNWMQDFEAGRAIIGVRLADDAGRFAGAPAIIDLTHSGATLIDGPSASGKSTLLDQFREGARRSANVEIIGDFTDPAHTRKAASVQDTHNALDRAFEALDSPLDGKVRLILVDDVGTWMTPDFTDDWTSTTHPNVRPLAEEVEEVRARLSTLISAVARKGRSKGVHVLLSTTASRDVRVIGSEIRSLIGARVQLRPNGSPAGTGLMSGPDGPSQIVVTLPFPPTGKGVTGR